MKNFFKIFKIYSFISSEKAARGSSGGAVSGKGGKGFSIDPRILKQMKKGTKLVNRPQGLTQLNLYENLKINFLTIEI